MSLQVQSRTLLAPAGEWGAEMHSAPKKARARAERRCTKRRRAVETPPARIIWRRVRNGVSSQRAELGSHESQAQVALDDCILYPLFPFFLCSCMHLGASIFSCCAGVCLLLGKGWGSAQEMNHGVWGVDSVGAVVVAKTGRHRLAPG